MSDIRTHGKPPMHRQSISDIPTWLAWHGLYGNGAR